MKTKVIICFLVVVLFIAFSGDNKSAQVVMVRSGTPTEHPKTVVDDDIICSRLDSIAMYKELMQKELNRTEMMLKDAKRISTLANKQKKKADYLEAKKEWNDISMDTIGPSELPVGIDEKELVKSIKEVKEKKE